MATSGVDGYLQVAELEPHENRLERLGPTPPEVASADE
jgi:hypothetical protein